MIRQVNITSQARADLIEQAVFIGQDNERMALRFLEMAEKTFEELFEMPGMGHLEPFENIRLKGVRRWRVRDFEKHLIFYRAEETGIEILRVIYAIRDLEGIFEEE